MNEAKCPKLCLGAALASILCESGTLSVPAATALRCELISDLREQKDEEVQLPLPLSTGDVEAWLQCATAENDDTDHASAADDRDTPSRSLTDHQTNTVPSGAVDQEEVLLRALKAADFLRDHQTMAAVSERLGTAVLGDVRAAPTNIEQARARKVVELLPQDAVLRMLHAIHRRLTPRPPRCPPQLQHHTARLLQLLPRTFHPAIVLTNCMLLEDDRGCVISERTHGRCAYEQWEGLGPAALTLHLLLAAARLAGGSRVSAYAWPEDGADGVHRGRALKRQRLESVQEAGPPAQNTPATHAPLHVHPPVSHACGGEWPWCSHLPGGCLTRLELDVPREDAARSFFELTLPLSCHMQALAQLRTLRALSLYAPSVEALHVPACVSALRSLPDLEQLSIDVPHVASSRGGGLLSTELLAGICGLSQLNAVRMKGCVHGGGRSRHGRMVLSDLLELPLLTSVDLQQVVLDERTTGALFEALPRMRQLQELRIEVFVDCITHEVPNRLLWALGGATQLTALRRVCFRGCHLAKGGGTHHESENVASFHQHLRDANPALLARMTEAPLRRCSIGGDQGEDLAALLADLPALETLDLADNGLGDGALSIVAAVLPRLTRLTSVDIGGNMAAHTGVAAVLTALLEPWPEGEVPLRRLALAGPAAQPQRIGDVAALVQRFRRLEHLDISALGLGVEGVAVVTQALQSLPHLRVLKLAQNMGHEDATAGRGIAPLTQIHTIDYGVIDLPGSVSAAFVDQFCRSDDPDYWSPVSVEGLESIMRAQGEL